MLTLFHAPESRSGRILWLLEEMGVEYDLQLCTITRMDGFDRRDPANPHQDGKVPALMHGDVLVTESLAIALYLTDLLPEAKLGYAAIEPERGAYLTWLAWTAGELEPSLWAAMSGATNAEGPAKTRYDQAMARLIGALEKGPYLMGDRFTAVDVMAGGALAWARKFAPPSELIDAYVARLSARGANEAACEKDNGVEQKEAA